MEIKFKETMKRQVVLVDVNKARFYRIYELLSVFTFVQRNSLLFKMKECRMKRKFFCIIFSYFNFSIYLLCNFYFTLFCNIFYLNHISFCLDRLFSEGKDVKKRRLKFSAFTCIRFLFSSIFLSTHQSMI